MLQELFKNGRVVGLAGEKNTGKTNNIICLITKFREKNKNTPIYIYGFNELSINYLTNLGNIWEINSIDQLTDKKDSIIILDEFQKLSLNDRRHRWKLNLFIDFIYHNNNFVLLSSPSLREFNSIIGGKIENWVLKSVRLKNLINGSQLKNVIQDYKGRFKSIENINLEQNKLLIINNDKEEVLELSYIKEVDNKLSNKDIFEDDGGEK
jgi:hypothetical protein